MTELNNTVDRQSQERRQRQCCGQDCSVEAANIEVAPTPADLGSAVKKAIGK